MKPTVGDIVHVHFSDDHKFGVGVFDKKPLQPHAAIITHVWEDDCVSLYVFPKDGGEEQAIHTGAISSAWKRGSEAATAIWWKWPEDTQ